MPTNGLGLKFFHCSFYKSVDKNLIYNVTEFGSFNNPSSFKKFYLPRISDNSISLDLLP